MLAYFLSLTLALDWLGPEFSRQLTARAKAACRQPFRVSLGRLAPVAATRALISGEEGKEIYVQFLKDRHGYAILHVNAIYGQEATSFTELLTLPFAGVDEQKREVVGDDAAFGEVLLAHWSRAAAEGRKQCGAPAVAQVRIEENHLAVKGF